MRELLPVAGRADTTALAWRLLRRHRRSLVLTVLAHVGAGLAGVVPVWLIGSVVDAVRDDADVSTLWGYAGVMAAAAVAAGLLTLLSMSTLANAVAPALASLREDVLDRALHLDSARVEAAGVGDVVSRVGDDVRALTMALDEAVPLMLQSVVTIAFTAGGLFALDWRLGLAGLLITPFYVLALRWYLPRSAPLYRQERTAQGARAEALVTGVHGAPTLRAFGREDAARERIDATSREALDVGLRVFLLYTRFGWRMNGSELIGLLLVLSAGFLMVDSGAGTVGEATAAALFFHRLFNPIGAVLMVFDTVQASGAALARLAGVVLMPRREAASSAPGTRPALSIRGVRHAYEDDRDVLHGVDLHVAPGERVAVVGATGAGKSTLGGIAAGTVRPTAGSVHLGAMSVADAAEHDVRRHVALVSQEVHLFAGTLRENLVLARSDASDDDLWRALATVGAGVWAKGLPDGLDTVVGGMARALTPAQAQQVALARVEVLDPDVVVLDEATAEAGSAGARDLEEAAIAVTRGRSSLVVAHRLTQARTADRVVVMDAGRVVESGTHDDLVALGGRYATLWHAWSAG